LQRVLATLVRDASDVAKSFMNVVFCCTSCSCPTQHHTQGIIQRGRKQVTGYFEWRKVPSEPHIAAQFEFGDHAAFTLPQFVVILQRASRSSTKSTDRLRPVYLIFSLLTYFLKGWHLAALKETLGPQNNFVLSLLRRLPTWRYPQPQLGGLQLSTDSRVERGAHSCRWISAARAHAAARRQMSTGQTDGRKDTRPLHRPCTAYCAGRVASVNVRGVKPHCMQKTHAWPVLVTVRIWTDCVASLLTQLGEVIAVVPRCRAVTRQPQQRPSSTSWRQSC